MNDVYMKVVLSRSTIEKAFRICSISKILKEIIRRSYIYRTPLEIILPQKRCKFVYKGLRQSMLGRS